MSSAMLLLGADLKLLYCAERSFIVYVKFELELVAFQLFDPADGLLQRHIFWL